MTILLRLRLISIFLLLISCTHSQTSKEIIISNNSIGNLFHLGQKTDSILKSLSSKYKIKKFDIPNCEGCDETSVAYHIFDDQGLFFTIEPGWDDQSKDKIFRFSTSRSEFVTDKKLKVGMNYKELKDLYSVTDIDYSGDLGIHVLIKELSGSFGIKIPSEFMDKALNYSKNLPNDAIVDEIIIVK